MVHNTIHFPYRYVVQLRCLINYTIKDLFKSWKVKIIIRTISGNRFIVVTKCL